MLEFAAWLAGMPAGHGVAHSVAERAVQPIALSGRVLPTSQFIQFATDAGGASACI
jgi:hypothetical protein